MTELTRPGRIYLDSNVLIYFVERVDEKQRRIAKFLTGAIEAGTTVVVE
jgi:predicted nucleic acid-binding protein